ncbi:DUF655 domain-containing protein [Candidatus Heimdallarchaeota archaeon]|jgi:putative nucleotide binding protein|nr:MAG: DUF655 domain-containing protein [Candidatus Heimdallarchaeota archaeon]
MSHKKHNRYQDSYSKKSTRDSHSSSYKQQGSSSQRKYEDYAWVLAHLTEGSPTDTSPFGKREPVVQAIGENWFTLLELTPRKRAKIEPITRIGIGKNNRTVISRIKRRIGYNDLASRSEERLEECILQIIEHSQRRFVNWFNKASLVTSRMHSFKLLPGIGSSHLKTLLEERRKIQFTSFEDIAERSKISDPKKLLVGRIIKELSNEDEKYRLFTRKP